MLTEHLEDEKLLDAEQTGVMLGYTARRVQQLAAAGRLPALRLPGAREFRFRKSSLRKLIERCETEAAAS